MLRLGNRDKWWALENTAMKSSDFFLFLYLRNIRFSKRLCCTDLVNSYLLTYILHAAESFLRS